jgi:predicted cobalt transporter CbtA
VPDQTDQPSFGELIDSVKSYAKQETLAPLKGAGRWLAFGVAGSLVLGLGLSLVLLGLLRLLQTELDDQLDGNWSWAPYAITLVVSLVVIGITLSRVGKSTLQRKETRR